MQVLDTSSAATPEFPHLLALPLGLVPGKVHGTAVVTLLNRVFAGALRDGELDFLQGRTLRFFVRDMRLAFSISLDRERLVAVREGGLPDLSISGNLYAFLLLAARREDSDTLFFQRRLHMEGNTELGLEVRNFLDAQDLESMWLSRHLERLLLKVLPLYERISGIR